MRGSKRFAGLTRLIFVVLMLCMALPAMAQRRPQQQADPCAGLEGDARRACLQARLRELETQRQQDAARAADAARPTGTDLQAVITRFEQVLAGSNCDGAEGGPRRGDRCADAIFQLGDLYFNRARDQFDAAMTQHSAARQQWERRQQGPRPVPPIPDFSRSLQTYWRLTREYPQFGRLPDAFARMSNIYLQAGHIDTARVILQQLIARFPGSPRVSGAHFNLANFAFDENQYRVAYNHLQQVKQDQVDPTSWQLTHFRKGNIAYNIGNYEEAVNYFYTYIDAIDRREYSARLRDEALEFLASSFADMPNGAQEAINFFSTRRGKPYEADVVFRVGTKNWERNQWEAAILALETAIRQFPLYKETPNALQMLIFSYMMRRDQQRANAIREQLVDNYGPGSEWHRANANDRAALEIANLAIRRALGDIALFNHGEAQRTRDRAFYERALLRYNQFFQRFPDDKWRVYEFNFNVAEVHMQLGNFPDAARHYNFVALENIASYPPFIDHVDTVGMDPNEVERVRAQAGDRTNPINISQEDAGSNAIVAWDSQRKLDIERDELTDSAAYHIPSTKSLIEQVMVFQRRFPQSARTADLLNMVGQLHFNGHNFPAAIEAFKIVVDNHPTSEVHHISSRMLGNAYSRNGQFDLAMQTFDRLLTTTPPDTEDYGIVVDLAAGAMFRHAEDIKRRGDRNAAAAAFMAIAGRFPDNRIAELGWTEAGICFEEMNDYEKAGQAFLDFALRFTRSTNRESAFLRSAENFKKANLLERAAETYITAANTITTAEFAIPSLSAASEVFQQLEDYARAGEMFELIFQRYRDDPQTPLALYNAGLMFEKGEHFAEAIRVYQMVVDNFPRSEYAADAFFSIGLCWEKLGEYANMAEVFVEYARRFGDDKFKLLQGLVKAGDAFFNMEDFTRAEQSYTQAFQTFERFRATDNMNVADAARASFRLGEITHRRFMEIELTAANPRAMTQVIQRKVAAMAIPTQHFLATIPLEVIEWTMRATHMVGQVFYDMAAALSEQTLFGNEFERIGGRINVLRGLDEFYTRAMGMFEQNIVWAKEQNIAGEYVEMSRQAILEMAFRRGAVIEEAGVLLRDAPLPDLSEEDLEYYMLEVEEQFQAFRDAAMPMYEHGLQIAHEAQIATSPWVDSLRTRLKDINPFSDALELELVDWVPEVQRDDEGREIVRDFEFERAMRSISDIMSMDIPLDEKIRQLNRMKMEADRNIVLERERVNRLRTRAGS